MFQFDVGHIPVNGALYVQHPLIDKFYLTPADCNQRLAREKLAAALGAKELRVASGAVKTKKWYAKNTISLPQAAAQVGINADFINDETVLAQVYARYDQPETRPYVPDSLVPWVRTDPSLRSMAQERLHARLREQKVSLEFREVVGLNASTAAKLQQYGIEIGGGYQRMAHSIWNYDVEYWPIHSCPEC